MSHKQLQLKHQKSLLERARISLSVCDLVKEKGDQSFKERWGCDVDIVLNSKALTLGLEARSNIHSWKRVIVKQVFEFFIFEVFNDFKVLIHNEILFLICKIYF